MVACLNASCDMKKSENKGQAQQKMEEAASDTKRATKELGRDAKEAACPIVNGKVECSLQKGKHNIQRGADTIEDAVD